MSNGFSTEPRETKLARYVQLFWSYQSSPTHEYEQVLPGVSAQLLINLEENELRHWEKPGHTLRTTGGIGAQGVVTAPVLIDSRQKRNICGVAFTSYGLSAFCDMAASRFTDSIVDAADMWGTPALQLRADLLSTPDPAKQCQVIEAFLLQRLTAREEDINLLDAVLCALHDGQKIVDIRARMKLSQRRLHALFDRYIGVRPKTFLRIARISSTLESLADTDALTDVAIDNGFSDQAHLTREFRNLTGRAPSQHQSIDNENHHVQLKSDILFKTPRKR